MPRIKLSYQQVQKIRELQGIFSSVELSKLYKVTPRQIRRIWNGTRWKKEVYENTDNGNL